MWTAGIPLLTFSRQDLPISSRKLAGVSSYEIFNMAINRKMIIAVNNFGLKRTVELDEMCCSYELYPTIYQLVVHCYSD